MEVRFDDGTVAEMFWETGNVQTRGFSDEMRSGLFKLVSRWGGVSLEYVAQRRAGARAAPRGCRTRVRVSEMCQAVLLT
jgi:hypothetical protein